ncbi:hypothetical protein DVW87_03435 [Sphingomonas aracearum]|uniref:Glycosyltransferase family 9 protein n=2 Tax=Sphingomonas aracearum TaxID=2283317 RepID=A0A369VYR7_9SPHN|nr:hypothetical protein DVW87_03435 [Sphingomonas aracearum]
MRAGDYPAAWAMSAAAMRARDPATRDDPALPYHLRWVWDGRPFEGRDVLVRCYHGLGDTIQFARFLPLLADRAASVTVEAPERLLPVLATVDARLRLLPFDVAHPLPPAECDLEITELDHALRTAPDAVPVPYVVASRAVLPRGAVGLCYKAGDWDAGRNVPPDLLAPLTGLAPCLTLNAEPTSLAVLNPDGCAFDMGATVALVAGCDLVITVDTMIAHLAGALGRPVWLMLKAEPDWRWAPERSTSAWYPSARLYVQEAPADWSGVVARVAHDLSAFSTDRRQESLS